MVANNARRPMTPEAPKRSLDAPSEAALASRAMHIAVFQVMGTDPGPHATGNATCQEMVRVLDRLGFEVRIIEREAAHPVGTGSSSNEYAGITNYPTPGDDER